MRRRYKANASPTAPLATQATSEGFPTEGDITAGVDATVPGPFVFYMLVEAIVSIIEQAGETPDDDPNQFRDALVSLINTAGVGFATGQETIDGTRTDVATNPSGVRAALDHLIGTAPGALNMLGELADAIADDPNFSVTINNALAARARLDGAVFTGDVEGLTRPLGDESTHMATTAFVQQSRPIILWAGSQRVPNLTTRTAQSFALSEDITDFRWIQIVYDNSLAPFSGQEGVEGFDVPHVMGAVWPYPAQIAVSQIPAAAPPSRLVIADTQHPDALFAYDVATNTLEQLSRFFIANSTETVDQGPYAFSALGSQGFIIDFDSSRFISVDIATGVAYEIRGLGGDDLASLAERDGLFYTIWLLGASWELREINPVTGLHTEVLDLGVLGGTTVRINAMTNRQGSLYFAQSEFIRRIDFNGAGVPQAPVNIGDSGLTNVAGMGTLNNQIYATSTDTDSLYTIDHSTGVATLVQSIADVEQPVGLAGLDEVYLHDSPSVFLEASAPLGRGVAAAFTDDERERLQESRRILAYPWYTSATTLNIYSDYYNNLTIRQIIGIR